MALVDITKALAGLNDQQKSKVIQATNSRLKMVMKVGAENDSTWIERTITEYADDLRKGRELDWNAVGPVARNGRDYREQYRSPRADN